MLRPAIKERLLRDRQGMKHQKRKFFIEWPKGWCFNRKFRLLGVDDRAYSGLTVSKLKRLHDNYVLETTRGEDRTNQEVIEEDEFLDAVISTSVMQAARKFLIERGIVQSIFDSLQLLLFHYIY